ncbi:MAG: heme ABC transporter ATP-binding protein [Rhodobacteraceae bacterium]|nr:heme ABC transporter ATP-binding protein [Paracoccaceae bacterium]
MLEACGITLMRGGRAVLDDLTLTLRPGECTALVGPNGAGKSSLLAVLSGELAPARGRVTLAGRPLSALGAAGLAKARAVLEQAPSLSAPFPVAELVALGMAAVPRATIDEHALAARAMTAVGIAHLAARPANRLSGGERARAHLARVLAQLWAGRTAGGGHFLMLDEPTASLDLAHQVGVMTAARRERDAGTGVLVVLHDLNLAAAFADRVVLLSGGRIAAEGPPSAVFRSETLSRVYRTPVAVERGRRGALRIGLDLPPAA